MGTTEHFKRLNFYNQRILEADQAASRKQAYAMKNPAFAETYIKLRCLPWRVARAEVGGDVELAMKLKAEIEELKAKQEEFLKSMNLSSEELHPKRICQKCADTGWTKDNRLCDCYKD